MEGWCLHVSEEVGEKGGGGPHRKVGSATFLIPQAKKRRMKETKKQANQPAETPSVTEREGAKLRACPVFVYVVSADARACACNVPHWQSLQKGEVGEKP